MFPKAKLPLKDRAKLFKKLGPKTCVPWATWLGLPNPLSFGESPLLPKKLFLGKLGWDFQIHFPRII